MNRALVVTLILLALTWPAWAFAQSAITVGSLNIEWFGHGNNPRTPDEIAALARYIKALQIDVLAVQEISPTGDKSGNGTPDWEDLLAALGDDFDGRLGSTGMSQHLGIIWRTDRVEVSDLGEVRDIARQPVGTTDTFPRLPFTAFVRSKTGGLDFRLIVVHLYWTRPEIGESGREPGKSAAVGGSRCKLG